MDQLLNEILIVEHQPQSLRWFSWLPHSPFITPVTLTQPLLLFVLAVQQ